MKKGDFEMTIIAILQARLGSTRLPGKSMAELNGKPLLWHVIQRLKKSKTINKIVVATTTNEADNKIAQFAKSEGVGYFQGSENDVLDRYYQAAKANGTETGDVIVRVTADCPLLDPEVVDKVVGTFVKSNGKYDYVCNTQPPTYPDGLDTEVFSFATLERAWKEAKLQSEREHVTPYIWKQPDKFHIFNVTNEEGGDLSEMRWTVDEPQDLEFVRAIYGLLGDKGRTHSFTRKDVFEAIERNKKVIEINKGFGRNEGYEKSMREDKKVG
ncbi:TPA: NTP transferase domain-containing protein [Candidatus Micrarchaeota archaeon]|nr:NTP transferase domain-containing protein [Candidatus Micrarchaeota archaeon]